MYLLDISVYIGNTLTFSFVCKELNHWNRTKKNILIWIMITQMCHTVWCWLLQHIWSNTYIFHFFKHYPYCWLFVGVLLQSFPPFVGVYAPSLPNMQWLKDKALWFYCSQTLFLAFHFFDIERTWWRLFQKRVVRTKFHIYAFNIW